MKMPLLLLGFALLDVISPAPIEDNNSEAPDSAVPEGYWTGGLKVDPTQYAQLLENLKDYEDRLKTYFGGGLLGTGLKNDTLLAGGLGFDLSVSTIVANEVVLEGTNEDTAFMETPNGYEELLGTGPGNETLMTAGDAFKVSVASVFENYMVLSDAGEDESLGEMTPEGE